MHTLLRDKRIFCLAALVMLLSALPLTAQQNVGVVTGTVQDSTDAVIVGADVTITNEDQGTSTTVQTQTDGTYLLPDVQPGNYSIAVESQGFQRAVVSGLRLDVGGRIIQDFRLQVGQVTETVTVEGITTLVDTTRGAVGDVVENKRVNELPLNGR